MKLDDAEPYMPFDYNPEGELDPTEAPDWSEEPRVHNPGSDARSVSKASALPAEPGSPQSIFPVPVLAEQSHFEANAKALSSGECEARESANVDVTEAVKSALRLHDSRGGENLSLDQTEATAQWFDERGAEAEAYTRAEADARRKEGNE